MQILIIDDEPFMVSMTENSIRDAYDMGCEQGSYGMEHRMEIMSFTKIKAALAHLADNNLRPDVAFLDVEMPEMSGLELAVTLKKMYPRINIIFVTAYSEYAVDAMHLHSSGYILKPITPEDVKKEMDNLRYPVKMEERFRIQCFGNFEVFYDNKPVKFQYSKTKELFAYLVDRRGAACNTGELCAVLWPDQLDTPRIHQRLRRLMSDLNHTLMNIGQKDIFIKSRNRFSVVAPSKACDYYRLLNQEVPYINAYTGEYMSQYSWAEMTLGALANM